MTHKLALGTVQFGLPYGVANSSGQPPLDEMHRILDCAREAGIDTLDTAVAYGDSERRLGEYGMSGWRVISKLPARSELGGASAWARACLKQSLADLKVNNLAGLMLHQSALLLGPEGDEIHACMCAMKDEGLVGKVGISVYSPAELEAVIPRFSFDLVQLPFNILDRRMLRSGWLDRLAHLKIEIHARSCFLQGLLLMNERRRPRKFDRWSSTWGRWGGWLHEAGISPLQACLAHSLSIPQISRVLVGVDDESQLREILQSSRLETPPPPDDLFSDDDNLINPSRWNSF